MSDFIILNGFDRSGTSAISRTLATHPKVELIMQPFNSGFIREKMYQLLDVKDPNSPEHIFFTDLQNNRINNDLINSHWHQKYSTTTEYVDGHLHIVKTTINHFAQKWMDENYAEIDVWGIWRDPKDILESIIKNDFYTEWYDDAIEKITITVIKEEILKKNYLSFIDQLNSEIKKTAFLIAVRSHFFFKYLTPGKVLNYELFKKNPNYLNVFLKSYH